MKKLYSKLVVGSGVVLSGVGVSMAQDSGGLDAPDFGSISESAITTLNGLTPILLLVGGAIIALAAVALGIKWVKATFF